MFHSIRVVANKEIRDNLRDRRTLLAALLYPILGPVMILLLAVTVGRITQQQEHALDLPVVGSERAPNLMRFLTQRDIVIGTAPEDPVASVRRGDLDVVLVVPESFGEALAAARPAPLTLIFDESRTPSLPSVRRVQLAIQTYSTLVGRLRLQARGVDSRIIDTVALELNDLSTPESQAARLFSFAPYFIVFSAFVGGMYLAIDSTAGERERGSLEPLLVNPSTRSALVMGKALAVLVFTAVAVGESVAGFGVVMNWFPLERYLGMRLSLPWEATLTLVGLMIPLMLFAVATQMVVASYTKSFKEAQNYISLLLLVPALPAGLMAIVPVKHHLWMMVLPTFGQQLLMNQVLRGETVATAEVALCCLATVIAAAVLLWFVIRRYRRESILFR